MADQGSNYWLIGGGGESPAPPTQTPPTTPVFGPVTASGYAIAPIDPLSYYAPIQAQEPVTYQTPVGNAPTRWTDVYKATPTDVSLADIASIIAPVTPQPEPVQPQPQPEPEPTSLEDVVSTLPDWIKEEYIRTGKMPIWTPEKPSEPVEPVEPAPETKPRIDVPQTDRPEPIKTEEGTIVYPGTISPVVIQPEAIKTVPVSPIEIPGTSVTTTPVNQIEERVTITPQKFEEFQFNEPAPVRTPIVLLGTSVISRPSTTPVPTLPTVPTEITRKTPAYRTGFQYINYDPEEILAAAMRSMGGSRARQSIAEEAQIFNRMRNR